MKHKRGPHPGAHRARRGAIVHATLLLLNEQPRQGYDIIAELEERSGGAWRPSPGSIYPALKRLSMKGLVEADEDEEGKRIFSITDQGRERLAAMEESHPAPWDRFAESGPGLRPVMQELMSLARQVARFGTEQQRERAMEILTSAKSELYAVMAEPPAENTSAEDPDDTDREAEKR
ncbi:MAG: helix-turn-helix transcriptional regulator [Acidimicrobiia bacterium]